MNKKELSFCPYCGEPMIFTFMIPGSERYCLNCGYDCGCFGGNIRFATQEELIKHKYYKNMFKVLYKDIIPTYSQKCNCKKCNKSNEYHYSHATKNELLKDKIARELLKSFIKKK